MAKLSSKEKAWIRRLWVLYRLTPVQFDLINKFQQDHVNLQYLLGKRNSIDHDHKTGLIRGRLEWRLNRAYGMLEKIFPNNLPDVLRALALYHEFPPATHALGKEVYGLIGKAKYKKKMIYGPPKNNGKNKKV